MSSNEVRKKYLDFFIKREHQLVPSASLVPEDPTTLFTSAGMQPMIPYLLGQDHPQGKRIVDSQRCLRSQDIEQVGDNRHTTFFEMLGNWSFGDYWKKEQLAWLWQFLTDENIGLGLDPQKLYVSAFEGSSQIPRDDETIAIWQKLFQDQGIDAKLGERIHLYGMSKNWWSRFDSLEQMPTGEPGGPDSEVFYEFTQVEHSPKFGKSCHPNCECGRFLEIANSVFMQYQRQADGTFAELPQKNVDFGGGLERLTAACLNQPDIFRIDLFWPIIQKIEQLVGVNYNHTQTTHFRVIADHLKAATFLIKDGITPSNKLRGYVLRRLLRRSAVKLTLLKKGLMGELVDLVDVIVNSYQDTNYFNHNDSQSIKDVISQEVSKFQSTLQKGLEEIQKLESVDGVKAFDLYQSYGFPFEIIEELLKERGVKVSKEDFDTEFQKHQQLSRQAAKQSSS